MPKHTMPCPKCKGKGKISLPIHLVETYNIVKRRKTCTAKDVFDDSSDRENITRCSFNSRLEDLRKLGLIDRERYGRTFKYFIKTS